jgi:ketosteroid isomerase-like protein
MADWARGDFGSTDWAHPEIEYVWADGPLAGRWIGLAAMAKHFGDFMSAWEQFRMEPEEFREIADGRVLVLAQFVGRGKTSGLELEQMQAKGAGLFHIRRGKVTRYVGYLDREHALADLGLAPCDWRVVARHEPTKPSSAELTRRHVEIIKRGATAISESDVETLLSLVAEDFELHPAIAGAFVGATIYRGREGARRYLLDVKEVFEDFQFRPLSFSAWRDYLICPSTVTGSGRASGVEIDWNLTAIWRVRGDQVVWGATFFSLADGLAAIGAAPDELVRLS